MSPPKPPVKPRRGPSPQQQEQQLFESLWRLRRRGTSFMSKDSHFSLSSSASFLRKSFRRSRRAPRRKESSDGGASDANNSSNNAAAGGGPIQQQRKRQSSQQLLTLPTATEGPSSRRNSLAVPVITNSPCMMAPPSPSSPSADASASGPGTSVPLLMTSSDQESSPNPTDAAPAPTNSPVSVPASNSIQTFEESSLLCREKSAFDLSLLKTFCPHINDFECL